MLEEELVEKIVRWLQNQDYTVKTRVYVGGKGYKEIDAVAQRKNTKIGIEVKTLNRSHNFFIGMAQCFQFLPYTNSMYMAVPSGAITKHHIKMCKSAGIGLLSINHSVEALVRPKKSPIEKEIPSRRAPTTTSVYFTKEGELLYSLIKLAALSVKQNPIRITSGGFGEFIHTSQQTASRRLLAMQKIGLVKKVVGENQSNHYRSSFVITKKGRNVLRDLEIELSNILENLK